MPVVRLVLAYDGTGFRGWARQPDPSTRTVEGVLAAHLERVLREVVKLSVAGRTDAGVHALAQVAHLLKGNAANLGAWQLEARCLELEMLGRRNTTEGGAAILLRTENAYVQARTALESLAVGEPV